MCKVCTGYHDANEMEHGLSACMVDNPLAKACGLSLPTGRQTTYLSLNLTALRKAKTVCNFGLSKCNRIKAEQICPVLGSFILLIAECKKMPTLIRLSLYGQSDQAIFIFSTGFPVSKLNSCIVTFKGQSFSSISIQIYKADPLIELAQQSRLNEVQ